MGVKDKIFRFMTCMLCVMCLTLTVRVFSQVNIGVALPLMSVSNNSEDKKIGMQMLSGIKDALQEYKKNNNSPQINIKIEDTRKDQATTLNVINKFGSDTTVIAVLGPVFSSELVNNVGASAFHKIPVITPTATQNFLAMKNDFIHQLNPTYDIRGRIIAKYAMNVLNMKNFIILSGGNYGKNFAESFTDEVSKNSGQILTTINYSSETQDLTPEFSKIKSIILEKEKFIDFKTLTKSQIGKLKKLKFQFSYLDSLINEKLTVSIYKLFGKNADKIVDTLGLAAIPYSKSLQNLVLGYVDAIYIPIANFTEISKISSQYFSENINLPILGTSDWNNRKLLFENKMYIHELYFDSDFYLPNKNIENLVESEDRNYYFGYDAMKLILDKISEGNYTRTSLNKALEKINNYKAKHNNITIKERTNHEMSIMFFKKGELKKLIDYIY